jgi:hydrogenase expression/formation protein HypE
MIAIVSSEKEKEALELMRAASQGEGATVIGRVVEDHKRKVVLRSLIGGRRIVDKLSGEQLPRIC